MGDPLPDVPELMEKSPRCACGELVIDWGKHLTEKHLDAVMYGITKTIYDMIKLGQQNDNATDQTESPSNKT